MNIGKYLRGEDRHVGTARITKTPQEPTQSRALELAEIVGGNVADELRRQHDEIAALRAENFKLAAGVCLNVVGDEGGTPYCKEAHEVKALRAEVEAQKALLRMIANRARLFPKYPIGYHLPEVFAVLGESPPDPDKVMKGQQ